MALVIGQPLNSAGCVTRLLDIIGREPTELEDRIGYHRGRLAKGYFIAVLKDRLAPGEFEFAGYTYFSGGKLGPPNKDAAVNNARTSVQNDLTKEIGSAGVTELQRRTAASIKTIGIERLAKCLPVIWHSEDMETDPRLPIQYPPGSGIMQLKLTVKKTFLVVAEVSAGGAFIGMNGFRSVIVPNVPYYQRVAVRSYLASI
jgi:hypothetical protein